MLQLLRNLAKHYNCYLGLEDRSVRESFSLLTGNPVYAFLKKYKDKFLVLIAACLAKNYLVSCFGGKEINGLESRHTYSIFGITNKAIKLCNPWNKNDFKEDYKKFYDKMKSSSDTEGEFWLKIENFLDWCEEIQFCKFEPNAKYNRRFGITMPRELDDNSIFPIFKLDVSKTQFVDFTVYQETKREDPDENKAVLNILIFRIEPENNFGLKLIGKSDRITSNNFSFCEHFEEGEYLVTLVGFNFIGLLSKGMFYYFVSIIFKIYYFIVRESAKLILSVQSLIGEINFQPVECSDSRILGDILLETQLSCFKKEPVQDKNGNFYYKYLNLKVDTQTVSADIVIIQNPSKTNYLSIKHECHTSENIYPLRSSNSVRDYIPPESIQIVSIHASMSYPSTINYNWNYNFIEEKKYSYPDEYKQIHPDVLEKDFLFGPRSYRDQNDYDSNPEIYDDQFIQSLFS